MRIDDFKYRFIDQPNGWLGGTVKVDWPILVNLRLDPFERTGMSRLTELRYQWFVYEFWRFVFVPAGGGEGRPDLHRVPPMQKGASFNLEAVKAELEEKMETMRSQQAQ